MVHYLLVGEQKEKEYKNIYAVAKELFEKWNGYSRCGDCKTPKHRVFFQSLM